jgi:hypothetical protein
VQILKSYTFQEFSILILAFIHVLNIYPLYIDIISDLIGVGSDHPKIRVVGLVHKHVFAGAHTTAPSPALVVGVPVRISDFYLEQVPDEPQPYTPSDTLLHVKLARNCRENHVFQVGHLHQTAVVQGYHVLNKD